MRSLTAKLPLSIFVLWCVFLTACGKPKQAQQPPPIKVTVVKPIQKEVVEWDEYTGRLRSPESVEIRPRVSGFLDSINFTDGQMVKKGDLLFVIDPRPYQAELDRAQASLSQAQAQLQLAQTNFARSQTLQQKQVIAAQEFDAQSNDLRSSQSLVAAATAALATAKLNLDFTHVTAPIDGRVGRYLVSVGNLISGGSGGEATLLTTIVSLDPLYGYFEVDEQSFLKYSQMAVANAGHSGDSSGPQTAEGMPVEMRVSSEEGFPHKGKLDFVDNQVDIETSTVELRGIFPNKDMQLTPGLFARIRLPAREQYLATLIPDEAVGTNQSVQYVYVVDGENKVKIRPVELGPIADNLRVVRKGVTLDDRIIVGGLQRVRPDAVVQAEEEPIAKAEADGAGLGGVSTAPGSGGGSGAVGEKPSDAGGPSTSTNDPDKGAK